MLENFLLPQSRQAPNWFGELNLQHSLNMQEETFVSHQIPASTAIRQQPPEDFTSAADYLPAKLSLATLREAARQCQACDLWRTGRQTVFGAGRRSAHLMFIGEQPGNEEDLAGKPFVGPAGRLFDTALEAAGILRRDVYVTNAVKHFKWERQTISIPPKSTRRDEKRVHKTPSTSERRACRPWLDAEIRVVRPEIIVCLGAIASQALFGSKFRVTQHRGEPLDPPDGSIDAVIFTTVHPSAVLRSRTPEERALAQRQFFADIATVAKHYRSLHR